MGELSLEVGVGEDTGVLEASQDVVWDAGQVAIGNSGFEGTTSVVGFAVFGIREPTEKVLRAIVERILDKMVADTVVGLALTIDKSGTFAIEYLAHEDVAGFASTTTHRRSHIPALLMQRTHKRSVRVLQFSPIVANKIGASLACPDAEARMFSVADKVRLGRDRIRCVHTHRIFRSGDVADSEIRCKGRDNIAGKIYIL